MGRFQIYLEGYDVTSRCTLSFTGANSVEKLKQRLDASGYLFVQMAPGHTYLEHVTCDVDGGLNYSSREHDFHVASTSKATYFGDVRLEVTRRLSQEQKNALAKDLAIAGAVAGPLGTAVAVAAAAQSAQQTPPRLTVYEHADGTRATYRRRHGRELSVPLLTSLVAPPAPASRVVAQKGVLFSVSDLNGLKLTWIANLASTEERFALRVEHHSATPEFEGCDRLELLSGPDNFQLPIVYKLDASRTPKRELAQAEIDGETLRKIIKSQSVHLRLCKLTRRLTYDAGLAAAQLVTRYEAEQRKQQANTNQDEAAATIPPPRASADPLAEQSPLD